MTKTVVLMAAVLFGSSAVAQSPVVVTGAPYRIVNYDDLNLSSKNGQNKLVNRIRAAASDICFEGRSREEVKFQTARRTCFNTALSGGLDQMNQAVAAHQSGAPLAAAVLTIQGR